MSASSESKVPILGEENGASLSSGSSAPLLSPTAGLSSGAEEMVSASLGRELMQALKEAQEKNSKMFADNQQMRREVRRLTRRQSMVVPPATPLPTPPKVSSIRFEPARSA